MASGQLELIAAQTANIPGIEANLRQFAIEQRFVNRLYSLIPADEDIAPNLPVVLEFKPDQSFYCLKNVSIRRLDQQRFQTMKTNLVAQADRVESQSLSVIHFNPENILKRANLTFVQQAESEEQTDDQAQEPQEDAA
jgi:hypothetical protein